MTEERPSIVIGAHRAITDRQLREILLGMEEEGVPYLVDRSAELNPLVLAHEASLRSRLGVGMGVSLDYVVITTEKLPPERPYIADELNHNAASDRALGANAARIVKRLPLTNLRFAAPVPAHRGGATAPTDNVIPADAGSSTTH